MKPSNEKSGRGPLKAFSLKSHAEARHEVVAKRVSHFYMLQTSNQPVNLTYNLLMQQSPFEIEIDNSHSQTLVLPTNTYLT